MKYYEDKQNWMGTVVTFKTYNDVFSDTQIQNIFNSGFLEFEKIVKLYSRFDENSMVSIINNNFKENFDFYQINQELFEIFEYMLYISRFTNGIFDPSITEILIENGYTIDKYNINSKRNIEDVAAEYIKSKISYLNVELKEESDNYYIKLKQNQKIEIGGMGKGYAIDKAYQKMIMLGLNNFLIDAGGDIRAYGEKPNNLKWKIELYKSMENMSAFFVLDKTLNFKQQNKCEYIELSSGDSICSSGNLEINKGNFHHLIDPNTGLPKSKYSHIFLYAQYNDFINMSKNLPFKYKHIFSDMAEVPLATLCDTFATVAYLS